MTDLRWVVSPEESGVRLDKFLAQFDRLGSRSQAAAALERGKVFVNEADLPSADASQQLRSGDRVRVWIDRPGSSRRRLRKVERPGELAIVFEDDAVIVVNKPAGLLAVPLDRRPNAPAVTDALSAHLRARGKRRPFAVHRIDRDTSGLVVYAARKDVQPLLEAQFRRHEPERIYLAVLHGTPEPRAGTWSDRFAWDQDALVQKPAGPRDKKGVRALSSYRVVEAWRDASLVEITLETGLRNQIRLQAWRRGHPLVGERRYVGVLAHPIAFQRQALHAYRLAFRHPVTGQLLRFEAPVAADMRTLLRRLRGENGIPDSSVSV